MRRRGLLLIGAVLLAGCSSGAPTAEPTPTPALTAAAPSATRTPVEPADPLSPRPAVESPAPLGGPTCDAATLSVQDADLLADATQLQEVFAVRTTGPACQLRGWPDVSLLGDNDAPLTLATRRTGSAAAVSLSRTTSVSFVLSTPRSGDCQDVSALVVTLPGTRRAIRTGTTMQVCGGQLSIGPLERRADAEGGAGG